MAIIPDYIVKNFSKGQVTRLEKESIPKGASSGALNWLTLGDRIELRRGQQVLGNSISGTGKISGLIVASRFDGFQVPIRSRGKKIEVYNVITNEWEESHVQDILGDNVIDESTVIPPIETGLIAHYKLNEDATNTNVEDASENQSTATSSRSADLMTITGKINTAFDFNGTDDYINIPHNANQLVTSGFSLAAWINPSTIGGGGVGRIIDKSAGTSGQDGFLFAMLSSVTSARLIVRINNSTTNNFSGDDSVPFDTWSHVVVTISADGMITFYVNGAVSGTPITCDQLPSTISTLNDLRIGNRSAATDRSFDGGIDDVRIYDSVLSLSEIEAIYNDGNGTESALDSSYVGHGEDIAFSQYHSLAGATVYAGSPNSSKYKIMLANPLDVVDQLVTDHRGKFRIKNGRMLLWDRKSTTGGSDKTGLYGGWVDKDELSDFTEVVAESIGSLGSTNYTGTLAFKTGQPKRTCMYVTFQATTIEGTETFIDDRNGNLSSNFGGTGTINYATGVYDVTFNSATTGAVTSGYYWEDATDEGILDFSKSTPREAGEGFVLRQDDGGAELQNVATYGGSEYCLHVSKTWKLNISSDDEAAAQEVYRIRVGIPYWRAMVETGDGIYYVDDSDAANPFIRMLSLGYASENVIPNSISDNIDLSSYVFDQSVMQEWGTYITVDCRTSDSTINNRRLLYHKLWKSWDVTDFRCSVGSEYNGGLLAGDSGSDNVFSLFDSFADEDSEIPNFWNSGKDNLEVEGVKRAKRMVLRGLISHDQWYKVRLAYDGGDFVEVAEIRGDAAYVDSSNSVTIGAHMLAEQVIGGDGGSIDASPYAYEFTINTPKFEKITLQIEAMGVGYVSVSEYAFKDIRYKGRKLPVQYRT